MNIERFQVEEAGAGRRLDRWLAERFSDHSRSQIQTWIQKGRVRVDGSAITKPGTTLEAGGEVAVDVPPPREERVAAQDIPLEVLHEDDHLIAVHKPAGMVVYPAPGHPDGTLINALLHRTTLAQVGAPVRPGIVHRLDKDTSGVMVVARTDRAYHSLIHQFKERLVEKTYLAWLRGRLAEDEGRIEAPIGRHPVHRQRMAVVRGGKQAVTEFKVLERTDARSLVEIDLHTGRMHQIRVHCAYIKHPVWGDPVYSSRSDGAPRLMLHAWKLAVRHPTEGHWIKLEASAPPEFEV